VTGSDVSLPISGTGLRGQVVVSHLVIAKLAGTAARGTYGVLAMQASPIRRLARFFRGSLTEGVEVEIVGEAVNIGLHVVMERGLNLAQVTANLQDQVRYAVERVAGVPVAEISVRVEDLKD
jgi:uncharacterized alkaline shock family protein YloU